MADNILTKDRLDAYIDIAAKDIGGVLIPRNIIVNPDGEDLTPLTDAQLRAAPVPMSAASLPLPAGAATDAAVAALSALLTTISGSIANHNGAFVDGSPGQVMLGKRRDSDSTLVADGDLNTFNMDEEGRLKVSSKPASYPDIIGDITAVQATIGTPVSVKNSCLSHLLKT